MNCKDLEGKTSIEVFDSRGKLITALKKDLVKGSSVSLNVATLASGSYFIEVSCDGIMIKGKFVKD